MNKTCVLVFTTTLVRNLSHPVNKSSRYYRKCTSVFRWSTRYSCQFSTKHERCGQIFEKFPNVKFHKNPAIGSRVVPSGGTDGQTHNKANGRFSKFCERPNYY